MKKNRKLLAILISIFSCSLELYSQAAPNLSDFNSFTNDSEIEFYIKACIYIIISLLISFLLIKYAVKSGVIEAYKVIYSASKNETNSTNDVVKHNPDLANNIFDIKLQKTYFEKGLINIPVRYEGLFAAHGESIVIKFGENAITKTVDRTSNTDRSPRLYVGNQLSEWFNENFKPYDNISIEVINPNSIRIFKQN